MADEDEQLRVRVAWLYFMEGLTQADIAGKLGITRLRANRLLGEARASGLVNIQVNARLAGCVELERLLVQETGLKDAVVVPTPTDPDQIAVAIGRATADYLARHLGEIRVRGVGIGWGTTLRETIRHLHDGSFPEISINSMMGGLTHGLELNTFELASEFARRINGQCNYLAAMRRASSLAISKVFSSRPCVRPPIIEFTLSSGKLPSRRWRIVSRKVVPQPMPRPCLLYTSDAADE